MERLPAVVFDHFRAPRNEGELLHPDAVGVVEGRKANSRLTLYLVLDATRSKVHKAGYTVSDDRSSRVGLSLLTTWLAGRTLAEVEAIDVEGLAKVFGLPLENWPMLLLPLELVDAALGSLRGEPPCPVGLSDGPEICHCLQVREGRIRRTIRRRALRTLEDVQFWTRACTGCRSCRVDVEHIVSDELRRRG